MTKPFPTRGIFPIAPVPFFDDGSVDFEGQKRVLDCMIDQGVDGICILANFSEQFLLSDDERWQLTKLSIEHVKARVPVIVTCSHFATAIAAARAKQAAELGAEMVMLMPPYHGTLLKAGERQIIEHFKAVADAGQIPIMVQDAPLSGVQLGVDLLVELGRQVPLVTHFKLEMPFAADKLRALVAAGGTQVAGPFDGEEAITLLADLDAGATGTMTSAMIPDLVRPIVMDFLEGRRSQAIAGYQRVLPAVNHENRQCGLRACKVVLKEGGVIQSEAVRHPLIPLHPNTRSLLLELVRPLEPIALKWGR